VGVMAYEDEDIISYVFPSDSIIRIKFKKTGKVFKIGRMINDGNTLVFEKDRDVHRLKAINAYGIPKVILNNTNAENIAIHENDDGKVNRLYALVSDFKKFGITKKFDDFETQVFLSLEKFNKLEM
jgi:hypothetical protein